MEVHRTLGGPGLFESIYEFEGAKREGCGFFSFDDRTFWPHKTTFREANQVVGIKKSISSLLDFGWEKRSLSL